MNTRHKTATQRCHRQRERSTTGRVEKSTRDILAGKKLPSSKRVVAGVESVLRVNTPGMVELGDVVDGQSSHQKGVLASSTEVPQPDVNASSSDRTSSQPLNIYLTDVHGPGTNNITGQMAREETCEIDAPTNTNRNSRNITPQEESGIEIRRIQNLHERRKVRKLDLNHSSPQSSERNLSNQNDLSDNVSNPQTSSSSLEIAYNNCKAELRDARRDKRVYIAFYEAEKNKNEELEKEKCHLTQKVMALEVLVSKKGKRFRNESGRWSGNNSTKAAKEKYQGVFMALLHHINKSANLCVTESYVESDAGCRIRNWSETATPVSEQTARSANVFVFLAGGGKAIPYCPMQVALKKEYYTLPFENILKYVQHRTKTLLQSPGFNYMSSTMKDDCMRIMTSDREVISRHRHSLSEAASQRKKHAKISYLKALGYEVVCKPVPTKKEDPFEEQRRLEKNEVHERCVMKQDGKLNTMFWRVAKWNEICKPNFECSRLETEMKMGDNEANKDGKTDMLFCNHPARLAFLEIRGYDLPISGPEGSRDVCILTLARADAWMTTALDNVLLEGKGGKRNNQFADSFQNLIPVALEAIIEEMWNDVEDVAPDELCVRINNSQDVENDPFGNSIRDCTVVLESPRDNCLYLLIHPKYFKEHVCSWYGDVKNCFIGYCEKDDTIFKPIRTSTIFEVETCGESEIEITENREK